jgi:hypothetical protein
VLTVRVDLEPMKAQMNDLQREQVPFAASLALTGVAGHAQASTVEQIRAKLHMPTRYTLDALFIKPARKDKLESMVYVKDGKGARRYTDSRFPSLGSQFVAEGLNAKKVIGHLFKGGSRDWKGIEWRFKERGLLPRGMAMVPGDGCPLDANGNVAKDFLMQMLAYFEAFRDTKQNMSADRRSEYLKRQTQIAGRPANSAGAIINGIEYFVSRGKGQWFGGGSWKRGRLQHLPPGIWQRVQHGRSGRSFVRPMLMFVRQPTGYRRYFDLEATAQQAMARHWQAEWNRAFEIAMRTAGKLGAGATAAERKADFIARGQGSKGWR